MGFKDKYRILYETLFKHKRLFEYVYWVIMKLGLSNMLCCFVISSIDERRQNVQSIFDNGYNIDLKFNAKLCINPGMYIVVSM